MSQHTTKNPELFTEISQNLNQLKNNDRIKTYKTQQKSLKANDNQKFKTHTNFI